MITSNFLSVSVHTLITKQAIKICFRVEKLHRERVKEGQLILFPDRGENFRLRILPSGVIGHKKNTRYYPSRNCCALYRSLAVYSALYFVARQTTLA